MKREQPEIKDVPKIPSTTETEGMTKTRDGETDKEVEETKMFKMICNICSIFQILYYVCLYIVNHQKKTQQKILLLTRQKTNQILDYLEN